MKLHPTKIYLISIFLWIFIFPFSYLILGPWLQINFGHGFTGHGFKWRTFLRFSSLILSFFTFLGSARWAQEKWLYLACRTGPFLSIIFRNFNSIKCAQNRQLFWNQCFGKMLAIGANLLKCMLFKRKVIGELFFDLNVVWDRFLGFLSDRGDSRRRMVGLRHRP